MAIATLGFMALRDPMLFSKLAPMNRGYYQRQVLDTRSRMALRLMGALISGFGLMVGTGVLSGLKKSPVLDAIANGFLILLAVLFCAVFIYGIVVWIVSKGEPLEDWLRQWRTSALLGEIDVYPETTPRMIRESRQFTVAFVLIVLLTLILAVVLH